MVTAIFGCGGGGAESPSSLQNALIAAADFAGSSPIGIGMTIFGSSCAISSTARFAESAPPTKPPPQVASLPTLPHVELPRTPAPEASQETPRPAGPEAAKTMAALAADPGLVPKDALSPDQIVGMDDIMAEAIATKFIAAPLTKAQIGELVTMKNPPQ